MKYISIVYIFICVSFSMESSLVHHDRITSYLRGLPYSTKGSQDSYASNWRPNVFPNHFDIFTQLPKEIDHKYSSRRKQLSGSRNLDSFEVPIVVSKKAKNRDNYIFETLGLSGNNGIHSQLLNSSPGLDATEVSKREKNANISVGAASTTEELLHNTMEAPASSLFKEELPITHSTNTRSRFELLQLHRNKPHFSPPNDNTILLTIRPTISFSSSSRTSESVPSSISTIFSGSDRIPEQTIHHLNKRAVASSANFCHSRHLHKCGEPVIQKFKLKLDSATKCKIREDFLDCMVRQRKEGCFSSDDSLYTDENTDMLRSKIKSHLWSAHGCLLF